MNIQRILHEYFLLGQIKGERKVFFWIGQGGAG